MPKYHGNNRKPPKPEDPEAILTRSLDAVRDMNTALNIQKEISKDEIDKEQEAEIKSKRKEELLASRIAAELTATSKSKARSSDLKRAKVTAKELAGGSSMPAPPKVPVKWHLPDSQHTFGSSPFECTLTIPMANLCRTLSKAAANGYGIL